MNEPIQYKGYTIEIDKEETHLSGFSQYMFYKTSEGIQHDGDFDGEDWKYCGNCKWSDCIEDCKAQIDELTFE